MRPTVERTGLGRCASVTGEVSPRMCEGSETELGQVMLAYTVFFCFFQQRLSFVVI